MSLLADIADQPFRSERRRLARLSVVPQHLVQHPTARPEPPAPTPLRRPQPAAAPALPEEPTSRLVRPERARTERPVHYSQRYDEGTYASQFLGARLGYLRQRAALWQSTIARQLGVDAAVPSTWEGGNRYRPVPGHHLSALAGVLGVPLCVLLPLGELKAPEQQALAELRRRGDPLAELADELDRLDAHSSDPYARVALRSGVSGAEAGQRARPPDEHFTVQQARRAGDWLPIEIVAEAADTLAREEDRAPISRVHADEREGWRRLWGTHTACLHMSPHGPLMGPIVRPRQAPPRVRATVTLTLLRPA